MSGESNPSNDDQNDDVSGPSAQRHQHVSQPPPPPGRECHASPPLPVIPGELITEILLRLPVRSLVRFRCVCKQWKSMISDTHFAKLHLFRSTMDPTLTHHRLLFPTQTRSQPQLISCSVKSLFNNPLTPCEHLKLSFRSNKYQILGTCNGFVCLYASKMMHFWLCNPSTRLTSRESPFMGYTLDGTMLYHGFGYDHVSDKYKVVLVFRDPSPQDVHRTVTKVYAFGDSSWTIIQNLNYLGDPTNRSGRFVGGSGTLNWVALAKGAGVVNPSHVIHSFDLGKETFGEVLLPDFGDDKPANPMQAVLKDCLCICYDCEGTHLVVWLMKEYGVEDSWTKFMAIPHVELQISGLVPFIEPLCMSENGQVLLNTTFVRAVVYNPKDGRLEYPNIQSDKVWDTQYIYIYLESLVSPCF